MAYLIIFIYILACLGLLYPGYYPSHSRPSLPKASPAAPREFFLPAALPGAKPCPDCTCKTCGGTGQL